MFVPRRAARRIINMTNQKMIRYFHQKSATIAAKVQVPPPPSWSVTELRLTSSTNENDKISNHELAILARRCLIDIRRLSPERREKLRTHVGGIVRCASVLLDSRHFDNIANTDNNDQSSSNNSTNSSLTDEQIYDAPRGLTQMPTRNDANTNNDDIDEWKKNDSSESTAILQSNSVQSKMVKLDDSHIYFSVVTNVTNKSSD